MFKQIFENKIGEKLNNFNNSGKVAIEWMDKFRQSFDITEKIQQQFNNNDNFAAQLQTPSTPPSSSSSIVNNNNNINAGLANNSQQETEYYHNNSNINNNNNNSSNNLINNSSAQKNRSNLPNGNHNGATINRNARSDASATKHLIKENSFENSENLYAASSSSSSGLTTNHHDTYDHNHQSNHYQQSNNSSPPASPSHHTPQASSHNSLLLSPKNSVKMSRAHHNQNHNGHSLDSEHSSMAKSEHHHLQQSKSVADDTGADDTPSYHSYEYYAKNGQSTSTNPNNRTLVRQSTDLTSSFPLKPFQKINSETVEIPGLNVKVVRYRIENDLGKIEPHLYIKYNSSGGDASTMASKGKLFFSLHYNEEIQSFSVTINKAELNAGGGGGGLQAFNNSTSSSPNTTSSSLNTASSSVSAPNSPNLNKPDTYIKVQLLPDKKRKFQTRIQRKTWAPLFDETFYFPIPFEELQNKTLYLSLLEFGRFSKHELIGSVRLNDIHSIKDITTTEVEFVRNLIPLADDDLELGELTLTLCYLPAAGRLTVTVVKAINLKAMDINGKSDPYVKVTLVSRGKRLKKKKTSVMKNTLHPVYNESMLFDIPQDQIEQVDMVVKVIDYDRVGSNELIGCIGIGPSFNGLGRDHWYRMLENPRKPMTQSYYLRDSSFLRDGLPSKVEKALNSDRQESLDSRNSDL